MRGSGLPLLVVRAGRSDIDAIGSALDVLRPAALAVSLTDFSVISDARILSARHSVPFATDPVLHRMALPGYEARPGMRKLSYRPPDGNGPWTPSDLVARSRDISERVVEEQHLAAAGVVFAAAVAVRDPADPAINAIGPLLSGSILASSAWGDAPVIAPVVCHIARFRAEAEQMALVQALGTSAPQCWLLLFDAVRANSMPATMLAAARLINRLRARGAPVLVGRAGPSRRLWLALGADGVEIGLGRLEHFSLAEQGTGHRGPGHHPPRWEVPELLCSLPHSLARELMRSASLQPCLCPTCAQAMSEHERLAGTVTHNAWVVESDLRHASGLSVAQRRASLLESLSHARSCALSLAEVTGLMRHLRHLWTWPDVVRLVDEQLQEDAERAA